MINRLDQLTSIAKTLLSESPANRSEEWLRQHLSVFLQGYAPLSVSLHRYWYRAVKCESIEGFSNLRRTLYPPPKNCVYGRANLPGTASLYASWNIVTAIDEVRPKPGEFIQISSLRLLPDTHLACHIIGELEHIANSGPSTVHTRVTEEYIKSTFLKGITTDHLAHIYVDAFLAAWFRRPVEDPNEYKGTAVFSAMLYDFGTALVYPSVRNHGAMNIAIPSKVFDDNFEVFKTILYRVDACYDYGINLTSILKYSTDFSADGTIEWTVPARTGTTQELNHMLDGKLGAKPGWRVGKNSDD